ncbi:microtubule organization protein AKNA isoform X1 [Myotis daubentonii]|uniref:microtubule organization protein AKNA isoform X1 n=1 Tax=Myotis daubentonii TaxID=98922 RepID=UPI002873A431|nr:microtubule organization protein AKNA isoform X1 [Myotis daubentonii]XP_059513850.1 microtubule organization protein AKNA isoform X1 [Myotis daubentonii]XP_059513851.1 microtubule organization protein AKNA isoform X1 [Myotis daubentonii]XP_059513852.1 microtubule organization protein AKNA isoform X1 [Myotis daubentonii]XP_059513853.1 microtubule organization protein AKNA isoform X1 [Myotis daubentonii]
MASSGTEVHWSEPGLGTGPPRRRWTWAKEEKDACGGGPHSWGAEEPFPSATSPELLEDFCRAQQHLQPRQWDSEPQPDGHQGSGFESESESGESAEEEFEAEDVDSPESSNLPPDWLPQQEPPPGMTEEEPEEALGDDEAGESSPRSEYEASLCSGDDGTPSPVALGWGHATSWVASGKQASGDKLPEHSEVNPTVDLSSAKSWSSGTVSLGHPSDSLDSTWEGETGVPQPTALEETSPQSPSHHLLNPDDRTGGGVALATPTEFQDSSVPPAQSLQCPADRWRRGSASLSCPQPGDHSWKRARISPKALPSRFTGSVSRLSPPPRPAPQDRPRRPGATVAGHSSSDAPNYGRGRLNYPLPDFSKVGPRVRFPKEDSYHPPKARRHSRQPQDPIRPLIFKSPAEIVREVLLSSGEACVGKDPPPAHPITRVPEEFQTPEQATKLVHQLQEDYHKLLTKYAEAENTIDQLRLGAKVNLYSDPPKPSHSIHTGMVSQGTKVLTFTIPHPHSVERWPGAAEAPQTSEASGRSSAPGDPSPSSSSAPTPGCLPENPGIAQDQAPAQRTQALASQARRFLAKVESFVGLMRAGRLTPQDQLKVFQQLKAAHSALEEEYLKACREQHPAQRLAGSTGAPGKFDPGRELEAEIFQLGIRLEELKDHMEQNQQKPERAGSDSPLDSPLATPSRHRPTHLPSPSGQVHTPAIQTLGLEPDAPSTGPCSLHMNVEVSPAGSEVEDRLLGLPAPLRHKELQVEQDFHGLLERYLSVKSLPEAMRAEEEGEEEEQGRTLEVDGSASAPAKAQTTRLPSRQIPVRAERTHGTPLEEAVGQSVSVKAAGFHASMAGDGHQLGLGQAEAAPPGPGRPPHSRGTKPAASHQSSLTSLEGSGISERLAQKSLCQAGGHLEESWMASPETDSGFVGSETSRVSPLTQTPEHRLSHISTPGTLAQPFTASVPRDAASHPHTRGLPVPRRATEPRTPRSRAQRHPSTRDSPLRQRAPSFLLEPAVAAEMAVPGSQLEGRKRISEQLRPSSGSSPASTQGPAAAALPHGPADTTSTLLTRTGRDQAIRELQEEVSRLRLRLEDSLHQLPQGSPTQPASTFNHPVRARDRPADSPAAWGIHYGSKSAERLCSEPGGAESPVPAGRRRARSSSVPREVPRLSLSSESEPTSPRLSSPKGRTTTDSPQAARDKTRGMRSTGRVTFRGQYTGQEYHILPPKIVPRGNSTVSCPHCQPMRTQDAGGAVAKDPLGPSPTDAPRCPLCGQAGSPGSPAEGDGPDAATSGAGKSTRRNAPSASSPKQRSKRVGSPPAPPPGLWYLAAAPSGPAPPAFAYVSSLPVMPYPSATVFYAPPGGPTSAPATPSARPAAEWPPAASSRAAGGHGRSIQLDLEDLEELNKALSRAVQAAESVRATTKHMSRSLSADLRQAHSLRGSCLF